MRWHRLSISPHELRLESTLQNGQCFGWRRVGLEPVWVGVLGRRVLALRQTETDCLFRCLGALPPLPPSPRPPAAADGVRTLRSELEEYFQLATPLAPLYAHWTARDPRMLAVCEALPGMRVLRQEPVECLFSFICSSNNNIGRIGGMLQALRRTLGEQIPLSPPPSLAESCGEEERACELAMAAYLEGEPHFYTFPTAEAFAAASEAELRALGMGYRAAFVRRTAELLCERGLEWLYGLRQISDVKTVRSELVECHGVGPKVADCVALFSLDSIEAIPVDTHVWDIAVRDMDPSLGECKSLTPTVYDRVGDLFRQKYGSHAGWAHSLLFAAELPQFVKLLPEQLQTEMADFKAERRAIKQEAVEKKAYAKSQEARAKVLSEGSNSPSTLTKVKQKHGMAGTGGSSVDRMSTPLKIELQTAMAESNTSDTRMIRQETTVETTYVRRHDTHGKTKVRNEEPDCRIAKTRVKRRKGKAGNSTTTDDVDASLEVDLLTEKVELMTDKIAIKQEAMKMKAEVHVNAAFSHEGSTLSQANTRQGKQRKGSARSGIRSADAVDIPLKRAHVPKNSSRASKGTRSNKADADVL